MYTSFVAEVSTGQKIYEIFDGDIFKAFEKIVINFEEKNWLTEINPLE